MAKKKKTTNNEKLIERGEFVDSLDPPNHMVDFDEPSEKDAAKMNLDSNIRWPLLKLLKARNQGGVFVDPSHGETHWCAWADHPPSWMDPHLFVRMAREDTRVQAILREAVKRNNRAAWKKLVPLLDEIFAEVYLPYVFEQFEGDARSLLAQWMIRQAAYKATDPRRTKGSKDHGNISDRGKNDT